jgi:hypothetical protein
MNARVRNLTMNRQDQYFLGHMTPALSGARYKLGGRIGFCVEAARNLKKKERQLQEIEKSWFVCRIWRPPND